jgi:hypothetical protein
MTDHDETRERFLGAIAQQVPAERVVEVHLFPPIRQSGFESGVAVVAANEQQPPVSDEFAENRLAVYTAKYRLTLKGPERGKWDFAIQADADAPLVTVDKVVRGVQRRSGDVSDPPPERLTGDDFRAALPPPSPPQLAEPAT